MLLEILFAVLEKAYPFVFVDIELISRMAAGSYRTRLPETGESGCYL